MSEDKFSNLYVKIKTRYALQGGICALFVILLCLALTAKVGYKNNLEVTILAAIILVAIYAICFVVYPLINEMNALIKQTQAIDEENQSNINQLKTNSKFISLGHEVTSINHDLNNLLSVIMVHKARLDQKLRLNVDLDPEINSLLERQEKAIQRMSALTKALRRSVLSPDTLSRESCRVFDVAEDCKLILFDKIHQNKIKMNVNIPPDFEVAVSKDLVYQTFLNLLSNSVDAVAKSENPWIAIEMLETNHEIKFLFTDSGHGIPENVQKKLFTPLFTTKSNGTGVGLSFLKRSLELVGGSIENDASQINTTFVVKFGPQKLNFKSVS